MIPRQKLVDPSTHVRDARLYIVVVEGDTEYNYFDALRAQDFIPKHRVRIEPAKPTENKSASNPSHRLRGREIQFNHKPIYRRRMLARVRRRKPISQ